MSPLDDDDARAWAMAAVGAVNRRDHPWVVEAVGRLVEHPSTITVAVDVCAGILLRGVPHGGLAPSARIAVSFPVPPEDEQCPKAVELASDLLTGIASGNGALVASGLRALAGEHGFDVMLVLVRAAAAWVDSYVGLDGDTVDTYYRIAKDETA